jgi:hypothetical protein
MLRGVLGTKIWFQHIFQGLETRWQMYRAWVVPAWHRPILWPDRSCCHDNHGRWRHAMALISLSCGSCPISCCGMISLYQHLNARAHANAHTASPSLGPVPPSWAHGPADDQRNVFCPKPLMECIQKVKLVVFFRVRVGASVSLPSDGSFLLRIT